MTTAKQAAANRLNAQKSTGPRTPEGKLRAKLNARRHGLTTEPDQSEVLRMFRIILDDPEASPDCKATDFRRIAAFSLAVAEAKLRRARSVEQRILEDVETVRAERREANDNYHERIAQCSGFDEITSFLLSWSLAPLRLKHSELRTMRRYRAEAEVARLKALRRWIDVECPDPETKPCDVVSLNEAI